MNTFPKVLYFIPGMAPTAEQITDADQCGPGVAFRNATLIRPEHPIEDADGVAGPNIPANYAAAIPHISDREAVKARLIRRNPILSQARGVDTATPKPPARAAAPAAPEPAPAPAPAPAAPVAPQPGWGTTPAPAPAVPPAPKTAAEKRAAAKAAKAAK